MTAATNPPGSPEAVALGCTCPELDNGHGKGCGWVDGAGNPLFWFNFDCPIHGEAEAIDGGAPLFLAEDRQ